MFVHTYRGYYFALFRFMSFYFYVNNQRVFSWILLPEYLMNFVLFSRYCCYFTVLPWNRYLLCGTVYRKPWRWHATTPPYQQHRKHPLARIRKILRHPGKTENKIKKKETEILFKKVKSKWNEKNYYNKSMLVCLSVSK